MAFEFQPFSRKQRQLLHWWRAGSGVEDRRMVLADGAIRSGKTTFVEVIVEPRANVFPMQPGGQPVEGMIFE